MLLSSFTSRVTVARKMKSIDITKSLKNTVLISLSIFAFVLFTFYNKMSPLSTESLNKTSEVVLLQSSTDTIDQNEVSESVVFDEIYKKNIWGVGSGSGSFAVFSNFVFSIKLWRCVTVRYT